MPADLTGEEEGGSGDGSADLKEEVVPYGADSDSCGHEHTEDSARSVSGGRFHAATVQFDGFFLCGRV